MTEELTGRSAILSQEIAQMVSEHELICGHLAASFGPEITPCPHEQRLGKLREALERELSRKRVVVFGTTHSVQENEDARNPEFKSRLFYLVAKFAVTVMMEEWAADRSPSFASTLASELLRYVDVGTPAEDQFRTFANAPISFPAHDGTLGPCEDAPQFYEYGPLDKQESREMRMVENIQSAMEDDRVGLFIVGLAHMHSISTKLEHAGFNVAAYTWTG